MITKKNAGFTLVETIVAVSIFALVMGIVGGVYVNYVGKQRQQLADQLLQQDIQNFFDSVDREVRTSYGETFNGTQINNVTNYSKPSQLVFYNQEQQDKGENVKLSAYFMDNYIKRINFYVDRQKHVVPLTSDKVSIEKLYFTVINPGPQVAVDPNDPSKKYLTGNPMRVTVSVRACLVAYPTTCLDAQTTIASRQTNPFAP